jgi:hypothetical protein
MNFVPHVKLEFSNFFDYRETPIAKANNLKVAIGVSELVCRNETQTLQAKRIKVCQSNYPITNGYWKQSRYAEGIRYSLL